MSVLVRLRPDMLDLGTAAAIVKKAQEGEFKELRLFGYAATTRPDYVEHLVNDEIVENLTQVASEAGLGDCYMPCFTLGAVLKACPDRAKTALDFLTRKTEALQKAVLFNGGSWLSVSETISTVVNACPEKIDSGIVDAAFKICSTCATEENSLSRVHAFDALAEIAQKRMDLVTRGLIDRTFEIVATNKDEFMRFLALETAGAYFGARPDLAETKDARFFAGKLLSDSEWGFDADEKREAEKFFDLLVEKRFDLMKELAAGLKRDASSTGKNVDKLKARMTYDAVIGRYPGLEKVCSFKNTAKTVLAGDHITELEGLSSNAIEECIRYNVQVGRSHAAMRAECNS